MARKILLGILAVIILCIAGVYLVFTFKGDFLLQKFGAYVEETTGAPLVMESMPKFIVFPIPGLDLGQASWGKKDGETFVTFRRASVRVAPGDLLSGKLTVTSLKADGLEVTLRPGAAVPSSAAPGSGPSVAATAPAAPSAPASAAPSAPARRNLNQSAALTKALAALPESVEVTDGRIDVVQADGKTFSLSGTALDVKRSGQSVSLSLNGLAEAPSFSGKLEMSLDAELKDSSAALRVRKAVFTPTQGLPFERPITLALDGAYNLDSAALDLTSLELSGQDFSVKGGGGSPSALALVSKPFTEGQAGLRLQVEGSPRALLAMAGTAVDTADPKALTRLTLQGDVALSKGQASLTGLSGTLDGIPVSGEARVNLAALPKLGLAGALSVGEVKLDGYLPPQAPAGAAAPATPATGAQTAAQPPAPAQTPVQRAATLWPEVDLALFVEALEVQGIRLDKVETRIAGKDGAYTAPVLKFNALGGPVSAPLKVVMAGKTMPLAGAAMKADVSADISAPRLDMAQIARLAGKEGMVSGTGSLTTSLAFNTASPETTLSGKGSFTAAPLHLGVSLLPEGAPVPPGAPSLRDIDRAQLDFTAAKGVVSIARCDLTSGVAGASAKGTVNLPGQSLDVEGTVTLPGLAVLPVRLSGPLSAPSYTLGARSAVDAVTGTLEQHGVDVKEEVRRGLGRLLGR